MKIVTVEYRRLRTFESYQNETVGAVAEVNNEDPADVLDVLKLWVDERLGVDDARAGLRQTVQDLEWRKEDLERKVQYVERRWDAIMAFLQRFGIESPQEIPNDLKDLPF